MSDTDIVERVERLKYLTRRNSGTFIGEMFAEAVATIEQIQAKLAEAERDARVAKDARAHLEDAIDIAHALLASTREEYNEKLDHEKAHAAAADARVVEIEALLKAEGGLLVDAPAMAVEERTRAEAAERALAEHRERWQRLVNEIAGAFNNGMVVGDDAESIENAIGLIRAAANLLGAAERFHAYLTQSRVAYRSSANMNLKATPVFFDFDSAVAAFPAAREGE
jgi:chromosome segregation ATPase